MHASRRLDELETAHRALGGTGPGRRYATHQINQAYVVMLVSQCQKYCRDLHSESIDKLASLGLPPRVERIMLVNLARDRKLDRGNPNRGNIGADFNRFGMPFWDQVYGIDAGNRARSDKLEELMNWRNAIAHQDFSQPGLPTHGNVRLSLVRKWRSACAALAIAFDEVMRIELHSVLGSSPW